MFHENGIHRKPFLTSILQLTKIKVNIQSVEKKMLNFMIVNGLFLDKPLDRKDCSYKCKK